MTRIQRTITIDAPPDEVFRVLADLDRLPKWSTVTLDTHDAPGRPLQTGDTFRQSVRVLGSTLDCDFRVTEVDEPRSIAYEATAPGGGRLRMAQRTSEDGAGSRVELDLEYELPAELAGDGAARAVGERRNEREADHSLQNLKDLVESHA